MHDPRPYASTARDRDGRTVVLEAISDTAKKELRKTSTVTKPEPCAKRLQAGRS